MRRSAVGLEQAVLQTGEGHALLAGTHPHGVQPVLVETTDVIIGQFKRLVSTAVQMAEVLLVFVLYEYALVISADPDIALPIVYDSID